MPDVEINLIGHDRTGHATRSAANNLDQLARKVNKFNAKSNITGGADNATNAFATRVRKSFGRSGDGAAAVFTRRFQARMRGFGRTGARAGGAFMAGFIKTITFGQVGSGFANAAIRLSPGAAKVGGLLGAAMAGALIVQLGNAIAAAVPLLLGGLLAAGPIAFLLHEQINAGKQVAKSEERIAALRKRLNAAAGKDTQDRLRKEIAAEQRVLRESEKQGAQWLRLKSRAADFMRFVSQPLRIPLTKSLEAIGDGFDKIKRPFRDILSQIGPALTPLTKGVMGLFLEFIKAVKRDAPSIAASFRAWGQALPGIGRSLGEFFGKIIKDPQATIDAVKSFAEALKQFAADAGIIVSGLEEIASGYNTLATTIDNFENKNFSSGAKAKQQTAAFRAPWQRVWRAIISDARGAAVAVLSAFDKLLQPISAKPGSFFDKFKTGVHNALIGAQNDMAATKRKWFETDEAIRTREIIAKIKADKSDLEAKVAIAKAKLATVKNKKTRAKIQADIADLNLKIAIANAELTLLGKKKTKPKLEATKKDLEAKVAAAKKSLKTVHDKKTVAKIKADIAAAQAKIAQIKAAIAGVRGKSVVIAVSWRVGKRPSGIIGGKSTLGGTTINSSAGSSFAALNGGSGHRTGGPTPVNVEAPTVNVRAFLDSREIAAVVRTTVMDENRRSAHRARVGRR